VLHLPEVRNQVKPESISNLFTLLYNISGKETHDYFDEAYNQCTIRYGELKKQLAQDAIDFTAPLRERIREILADPEYLRKVATQGAEKARENARNTLEEVREAIGHRSF